ncbi:hypothetical protein ACI2K4_24455 [Micromonospora sp. NPDC050397]|uniref:hypothetical protein n=1 Tax=Micromonospora sp. NPDC050397 TaxID=3364279 RepID=UPI00384CFEC0
MSEVSVATGTTRARAGRPGGTPRFRGLLLAAAGALLVVTAAGCAEEPDRGVATAQTSSTPNQEVTAAPAGNAGGLDRSLAFVRCMREAGVQVDDPDPNGVWVMKPGDKTDPEFPAASEKCKDLFPQPGGATAISPEQLETMRRYAQCMRDNGVPDFADPGPQGFVTPPKDPAAAERAQKQCAGILGSDPTGPGQG